MRTRIERVARMSGNCSFFLAPKMVSVKPLMRHLSTSSVHIFAEKPLPLEKIECYVARMQQKVAAVFNKPMYEDHLLFMSYFTRLARENETLLKASKLLGAKKVEDLGLGYTDQSLLPGHCLLTVINSQKTMDLEHTFSLRPDLRKKPFYKAPTAPDHRLPSHLIQRETSVWPARHTSFFS